MKFKELQKLILENDIYIFYDNDYWEFRKYPMSMELTDKQDEECIIIHSENVDFYTFPKNQTYHPNCYGNGIMVLLANTPNHRIKGIETA